MRRKRRNRFKSFIAILIMFLIVSVGAFFGIQFFTKTGVFRVPGVVYYDESLNADEISILQEIFTNEISLDKDVTISARENSSKPTLEEDEFLYEILVPVADFYEARTDIKEFTDEEYRIIPLEELDFTKKLLAVNGEYYLDNYSSGATFRTIKFDSDKYKEEIQPLVTVAFAKTWPDSSSVLTMAQTGVTALSRRMNTKLNEVGNATYFAENIKDYLSKFDLTHTSNESSFTDLATGSNVCSDPRFIDTLTAIGLDIVELTGNHNQDCGNEAAINTIDIYGQNNIKTVGGGKTADEAAIPLEISEKGTNITFLAYNLSTGGATHGDVPGANQYYEENAVEEIEKAKKQGNYVIVDMQYYECSNYDTEYENNSCDYADSSAGDQIGTFRHLIDLGADMVVGTSAHQPQTFELYGGGAIYYGLGNLFFDQTWWPGTTRSLALEHYFFNNKLIQTRMRPTVYDANMQTGLMDADTAKWFISRLIDAKPQS